MSDVKKMEESRRQFKDLFNYHMKVPSYQRAYSWEEKQLNEFWDDLVQVVEHDNSYYLGHFQFEHEKENDPYYVVDGQQRLTTAVIFISCLRECGIGKDLPIENFKTVKADQSFFEDRVIKRVQDVAKRASQRRINDAIKFFTKKIDSVKNIEKMLATLLGADVTTHTVRNKLQATQVFNLQNSRGKPITNLDKVKASLMYAVYLTGGEDADLAIGEIEESFAEIYEHIEKLDDYGIGGDYIFNRHNEAFSLKNARDKNNLQKEHSYEYIKENDIAYYRNRAHELAKSFRFVADFYEKAMDGTPTYLTDILLLEPTKCLPSILRMAHIFGTTSFGDNEMQEIFRLMTVFYVRRPFMYNKSADHIGHLQGLLHNMPKESVLEDIKGCLKGWCRYGMGGNWAMDDNFNENTFHHGAYYGSRIPIKFILFKYENHLRKGRSLLKGRDYLKPSSPEYAWQEDHIYPRNPDEKDEEWEHLSENGWIDHIANLSLLEAKANKEKNNTMPYNYFTNPKYRGSIYLSTQEVIDTIKNKGKLTDAEMHVRANAIATWAVETWAVETFKV